MNTAYKLPLENETPSKTMETLSGNIIDFESLEHIVTPFDEIALVMSRLPVNNGHQLALNTYSLAHHSLWVMRYVLWITGSPKAALYALVYRAHEVYVGSLPPSLRALSYIKAPFDFLTRRIQDMVYLNIGLNMPSEELQDVISNASAIAHAVEAEKFFPSRNYQQYIEKIPEAAREIAWDHCDNSAIFQHMMEAYSVLMDALKDQEETE